MSTPILIPEKNYESQFSPTSPSGSPEVHLASSTIAILDTFLKEKAEEQMLFRELEKKTLQNNFDEIDSVPDQEGVEKRGISVDEFRVAFAEDWQLSQFWYTTPFAYRLAEAVHRVVRTPTKDSNVAYICCPTGYIAAQNVHQSAATLLLEYDQRFAVAAASSGGGQFIHYDLEADNIPDAIKGTVELAIVDPPYLNEVTNRHLARGLRELLHPSKGKLVLITSTSVTCLSEVYGSVPQLGPLRLANLQPEHVGLRNDFACWTTWEGGEAFGFE